MQRITPVTLFLTLGWASAAAQSPIDSSALRAHTYFLAHDLLAGRATGSPGAEVAAVYITAQCRALGLAPVAGAYLHTVPLEAARVGPGTRLAITAATGRRSFESPDAFVPNVGTAHTLRGFDGRAVFVGREQDVAEGSLGALDLTGAVAVTLGPYRGPAADTLARRGAIGMLHLIPSRETYTVYRRSRGPERLYHRDADVPSSFLPPLPSVLAGPPVAAHIAALLGVREPPPPQALDARVAVSLDLRRRPVETDNVACLLPGADTGRADTAIALTAHYDHLGTSTPDADGDSIYNGFSDNAAGVAMLLAIAQHLTQPTATPLEHSLLLLFFTGEERGLLGSDHYVAHPAWPLERTRAVVNLDAGAPPAPPASWRLAGVDSTGLGPVAQEPARQRGWKVTTSPPSANSDYFPFHREGVPAVFIIPGPDPYQGLTADSTRALRARWDRYHQAGDHWFSDFPFGGLVRYAEYALLVIRAIDRTVVPLR